MKLHFRYKIVYILFFLILIFSGIVKLSSQAITPNTLYAFDKYATNGAYAGLNGQKILSVNIREQWIGLGDSPKKYDVSYTSPIYNINGAIGAKISSFKSGISDRIDFDLTYNYINQFSFGIFSFGVGAGISNLRINKNKIITPSGSYHSGEFRHNDPYISEDLLNNGYLFKFSFFGMYYYNNFDFGIIFDKEISVSVKSEYDVIDKIKLNWQYLYVLNNEISFKIYGLLSSDFVLAQNDIGVVVLYENNYLSGFNIRGYNKKSFDSIAFLVGGNINNKLRLIYSYDFSVSSLRKVEDGTHEVKIVYNLGKKSVNRILPPIINNPRL